jgi:hypothetical protein
LIILKAEKEKGKHTGSVALGEGRLVLPRRLLRMHVHVLLAVAKGGIPPPAPVNSGLKQAFCILHQHTIYLSREHCLIYFSPSYF